MNWRLKIAKQAILVRIPFGRPLRRIKRQLFGYEPDQDNLRDTLADLEKMTEALNAIGRSFDGTTVLEIGSGWFPTIPIMLTIGGARQVIMTDLNPHMDEITFASTLKYLKGLMPTNQRLNAINSIKDLPITYLAPFDLTTIPNGTINYVISRTVLEHIPLDDLSDLLKALLPKLSPDGLMAHVIDHSDHLEHTDKSISKINFLTWTSRKHALINFLTKEGENRLRHHEYIPIFERAGYHVVSENSEIHALTRTMAKYLTLVPPYSEMSLDQISTLTSLFILSKKSTEII